MDLRERLKAPSCPAAQPIAGPEGRGPSVLCQCFVQEEREGEMIDAHAGVLLTLYNDPTTLHQFCCGQGFPGAPNSYTSCPVWQASRERDLERKRGEHGNLTMGAQDPDEAIVDEGELAERQAPVVLK